MPSMKELRDRVKSLVSTIKITSSMKIVSATKFKKLQKQSNHVFEFLTTFLSMEPVIGQNFKITKDNRLLIVCSGDRGLCGGYNANIARYAKKFLLEHKEQNYDIGYIGAKVDLKRDEVFRICMQDASDEKALSELVQKIKGYGHIEVLYTIYNSVSDQSVSVKTIRTAAASDMKPYILDEADFDLTEHFLAYALLFTVWHAQLCEFSTRMMAMDNATKNGEEMVDELRLTGNKIRQSQITSELSETVAGAEL